MPRLDNSNPKNLEMLREWGERYWKLVEFNPDDPGAMPPMDVCYHCWSEMFREWDSGTVEHPLYDSEGYVCGCCQDELTADDDEPDYD
jgi:hypothetical protein